MEYWLKLIKIYCSIELYITYLILVIDADIGILGKKLIYVGSLYNELYDNF